MLPKYLPCPLWHKESSDFLAYLKALPDVPRVVLTYYSPENRLKWAKATSGWDLHFHEKSAQRAWEKYTKGKEVSEKAYELRTYSEAVYF